ncbi:MAG: hypothetical protein JW860_05375 [Sedimentisphaerales bacterium]|nr:hypothetical protein [Sedimentisphaerales bacterium]
MSLKEFFNTKLTEKEETIAKKTLFVIALTLGVAILISGLILHFKDSLGISDQGYEIFRKYGLDSSRLIMLLIVLIVFMATATYVKILILFLQILFYLNLVDLEIIPGLDPMFYAIVYMLIIFFADTRHCLKIKLKFLFIALVYYISVWVHLFLPPLWYLLFDRAR